MVERPLSPFSFPSATVVVLDGDHPVFVAPALCQACGFAAESEFWNAVHADDRARLLEHRALDQETLQELKCRVCAAAGDWRQFAVLSLPYPGSDSQSIHFFFPADGTGASDDVPGSESYRRLIHAQERQHRLLAYEIHDGIVQEIVGAQMMLETILEPVAHAKPELADSLLKLRRQLIRALDEGRRLIREVRPPVVDEMGLIEAIRFLVHEESAAGQITVDFESSLDASLVPADLAESIFRIVQESLTNVKRHADTDHATVRLAQTTHSIQLGISDQGQGFEPTAVADDRFGLEGIRERVRLFGGTTQIEASPGRGTRIQIEIPL